jgi:chemotaxis protein MotB
MRESVSRYGTATLLLALLSVMGCADPKDAKIADLQQQNALLNDRLQSAEAGREDAIRNGEAARQRAVELQQALQAAQSQRESQPAAGGWEAVPGGAKLEIAGNLLFDSGKNELKPDARRILDRVVSDIRQSYSEKDIFVFGHTDSEPIKKSGWKDNYELSAERALAVVRYLQSKGIPGSRLVAAGCGEHRPESANRSNAAKAKNRRVEVFAVSPSLSPVAGGSGE